MHKCKFNIIIFLLTGLLASKSLKRADIEYINSPRAESKHYLIRWDKNFHYLTIWMLLHKIKQHILDQFIAE